MVERDNGENGERPPALGARGAPARFQMLETEYSTYVQYSIQTKNVYLLFSMVLLARSHEQTAFLFPGFPWEGFSNKLTMAPSCAFVGRSQKATRSESLR